MEVTKENRVKILVTGANGQLGRCIQDLQKDYLYNNFVFKTSSELDITNKFEVNELFKSQNFTYCINCAAYTAVDLAEIEIDKANSVNADGVKILANASKKNKVILIHISTDFVFDGLKNIPYLESDGTNPVNIYGKSKLRGELYIQDVLSEYYILRTSWIYSQYGNNFVKTMLKMGCKKNIISVVNNQFGSPTRAYDLAKVVLLICNSNKKLFGIYNFSNQGEVSWYDFAKEIFRLNDSTIKLKAIPAFEYKTPAIRPMYSVLNKSKIMLNFGIEINNWKTSLAKHFLNDN